MKKNLFQISLLLSLCAAFLCGCTDDNDPIAVTDGTPLTIHATADGFTSTDGVNTRAMENGYTTTFTTGDAIGVFAVDKNGAVIADCKNVKCTYSADGSWTAESSAPVYYYTGAQYFAYYPYKSELSAENITEVSGIVDYFNKNIATDQSSYAKYTACDLMTTTQNVSPTTSGDNKTLSFSFTHQMSLIEISLPMQKYKTSNAADAYVYSSPVIGATFSMTKDGSSSSIFPCNMGSGVYRYIVPAGTTCTIKGEFPTADSKTIEYNKEVFSLSSGNYKRLNVTYSDASSTPIVRALVVGDFYCKDAISGTGYLIPGNITELTEEQKAACLGIVMKVGRGTNEGTTGNDDKDAKNWTDTDTYMLKGTTTEMSTIHGYVLALKDGNGGNTCQWSSFKEQIHTNQSRYTLFCGYSNMQTIKTYLSKNSDKSLQTDFPAAYHASEGYETIESGKYSSPSNSSGWFLPSAGQCWYWFQNQEVLKESMEKAEGDGWYQYYWSSSESSNPTDIAWYVNFNYDRVDGNYKDLHDEYSRVRSCLAF
ncbi:fimbrillin family protein [Parabacteroides sp.]